MSLLEVDNIRKSYGERVAVGDVSFHVEAGEVFGLLGPNGAGKTTTMLMLAGLLQPDAGEIRLEGEPFTPRRRNLRYLLGMVPQDLAIYPNLTARENLWFFGSLYGLSSRRLRDRIDAVLDIIGLAPVANDLAETFSGGMKRRLNFGAALLHEPKLLILDEPTVGVDPQSRSYLLDCVADLAETGVAVIYASHYMEEVQAICRRVAIMDHGRMLANDNLAVLLNRVDNHIELVVGGSRDDLARRLTGLVEFKTETDDDVRLIVPSSANGHGADATEQLARVLSILRSARVPVRSVETCESNLERLFLELTGRHLRD